MFIAKKLFHKCQLNFSSMGQLEVLILIVMSLHQSNHGNEAKRATNSSISCHY